MYRVEADICRGDRSCVYKGRARSSIEYVALKSVAVSEAERVRTEVAVMCRVRHPNVVRFINWYTTQNHVWLVLELCAGGDLLSWLSRELARGGPPPEATIKVFGVDVMAGLHHMHHQGLLHCDLKPVNVLMDEGGVLKLSHFALCVFVPETSVPRVRGTPCYMAPELLSPGGVHSYASDLWAFGCLLFELAMGSPPFVADTLCDLVRAITSTPAVFQPVSGAGERASRGNGDKERPISVRSARSGGRRAARSPLSPEFVDLVSGLLRKDPAERFKWPEVITHPFWDTLAPPELRDLPCEPMFEEYLRSRGVCVPPAVPTPVSDDSTNIAARRTPVSSSGRESDDGGKGDDDGGEGAGGWPFEVAHPDVVEKMSPGGGDHGTNSGTGSGRLAGRPPQEVEGVDDPLGRRSVAVTEDVEERMQRRGELQVDAVVLKFDAAGTGHVVGRGADLGVAKDEGAVEPAQIVPRDESGGVEADDAWLSRLVWTAPLAGDLGPLIYNMSDTTVRPIVGTSEGESRLFELSDESRSRLPFSAVPLEDVVRMPRPDMEKLLTSIYQTLHGRENSSVKRLVASYCYTLVRCDRMANWIVNSSLMTLWIKVVCRSKSMALRCQIATLAGIAVRYATYISGDVVLGILRMLEPAVQDADAEIRQRAVALLGEALFYCASQDSGTPERSSTGAIEWPEWTYTTLLRCMSPTEDPVVRHFVARTVRNVLAQSKLHARRLCTDEYGAALLGIACGPRGEPAKLTATVCLGHMFRVLPDLRSRVLQRGESCVAVIVSGLRDENAAMQIACVNLLNICMWDAGDDAGDSPSKVSQQLRALRAGLLRVSGLSIVPALLRMLDRPETDLVVKAVVGLTLLLRQDRTFHTAGGVLGVCLDKRLPAAMDRLVSRLSHTEESSPFWAALRSLVFEVIDAVIAGVEALSRHTDAGDTSVSPSVAWRPVERRRTRTDGADGALFALLPLLSSRLFRPLVATVSTVSFLVPLVTSHRGAVQAVEALVAHADVKAAPLRDAVLVDLLPALCGCLGSTDGDMRVLALRIVVAALEAMLSSPSEPQVTAAAVSALVSDDILPRVSSLLDDRDPVPLYAVKLMQLVVGWNASCVSLMNDQGHVERIVRLLPNRTVGTTGLCSAAAALLASIGGSGRIEPAQLVSYGLVPQVDRAFVVAVERLSWGVVLSVIDVMYDTLYDSKDVGALSAWLPHVRRLTDLLSSCPDNVASAACRLLLVMAAKFGNEFSVRLAANNGSALLHIAVALPSVPPATQSRLLRLLMTAIDVSTDVRGLRDAVRAKPSLVAAVRALADAHERAPATSTPDAGPAPAELADALLGAIEHSGGAR